MDAEPRTADRPIPVKPSTGFRLMTVAGIEVRVNWSGSSCRLDQVTVVTSSTPLVALISELGAASTRRALVIDDGRLVGIVAPSDITRLLAIVELGQGRRPTGLARHDR